MIFKITIGRAARSVGISVETIRFYERQGLITQPCKPLDGSPREYGDVIGRLRFIRQAQTAGFSLREISDLFALRREPGADCAGVRSLAIRKREELLEQIERLSGMLGVLDEMIKGCPGEGGLNICTIVRSLDGMPASETEAGPRPHDTGRSPPD